MASQARWLSQLRRNVIDLAEYRCRRQRAAKG